MARKRQRNSNFSHPNPSSLSKRPRFQPETPQIEEEPLNKPTRQSTSMVHVNGLSNGCSLLNVKSRFEIYGDISRIRIDRGIGYISFRSRDSAEAAIAASLDPSIGIVIDDQKVLVSWPNDPLPQYNSLPQDNGGVRVSVKDRLSSQLLQPEVPLSRHGASNISSNNRLDLPSKAREIIAYDDLF